MDATVDAGDGDFEIPTGPPPIFKRLKERDPYKLLGIDKEADFEEVNEAFKYLTEEYRRHAPSREAIDIAHDKILKERMLVRQKGKLSKEWKKREGLDKPGSGRWGFITTRLEEPGAVKKETVRNRAVLFAAVGVISWMQMAQGPPTMYVAASALISVYLMNQKRVAAGMRDPVLSCIAHTFFVTLMGGAIGSVLPMLIPDVLFGKAVALPCTPEMIVALSVYTALFAFVTYAK